MLTSVSKSAPCTSLLSLQVDAEIIGCGSLTCMCIVSLTILFSYLIEGREVVQVKYFTPQPKNISLFNLKIFRQSYLKIFQSTVLDATFSFVAATLLMTAGGMACHTYNQVFALSGPPVIANLNISRNSQQVESVEHEWR